MENYEDVVLTTRIRLARNVKGYRFTNNMIDKQKRELLDYIKSKFQENHKVLELNNMDDVTKKSLVETHVISKELLQNNNTAIVVDKENNVTTMINEEDHFRIQALEKAFSIDKAYENIKKVDEDFASKIDYAYNYDYGYITACPTCLGTGMRVSVMLHLPALEKIGALERIFNAISGLGISVRGIYGENTNGEGSIFQISNQKTLGIDESQIIEQVKQVTKYIVKQERKAREILKTKIEIKDEIMRSYGIAKNALLISKREAMQILSNIRLGINMELISDISLEKIESLIENVGINTLRKNLRENFPREEENIKRAEYIKNNI